MINSPFFSIIMPTFNRGYIIKNAIDSVLNQTFQDFELIVVDDGSTDLTKEMILKTYGKYIENGKIIYIYSNHVGCANARNMALKQSKGQWCCYIDTDNTLFANFLSTFYSYIIKNPNELIFYCDFCVGDIKLTKPFSFLSLLQENYIDMGCIVHKKTLYLKHGGFSDNLKRFIDWDLIIKYSFAIYPNVPFYIQHHLFKYLNDERADRISNSEDVSKHRELVYKNIGEYFERYLDNFITFCQKKDIAKDCILSLTTFPYRINALYFTIISLLSQTLMPEKIIITLSKLEFRNKCEDLPRYLCRLKEINFEVLWVENNEKGYKKIFPLYNNITDKCIITVDDDIIYDINLISTLYNEHKKNPKAIQCCRAHLIKFNERNRIAKYSEWSFDYNQELTSNLVFFTGAGGILYPPKSLPKKAFSPDIYTKLCPEADDVWLWAMAVLNKTPIHKIKNKELSTLHWSPLTQDGPCLYKTNMANGNDLQLDNLIKKYPKIYLKVRKNVDYIFLGHKKFKNNFLVIFIAEIIKVPFFKKILKTFYNVMRKIKHI